MELGQLGQLQRWEIDQLYHAAMCASNRGHSNQARILIKIADREAARGGHSEFEWRKLAIKAGR